MKHNGRNSGRKLRVLILAAFLAFLLLAGIFLIGSIQKSETIQEAMRDAVLHENGKVSLFGLMDVNPAVISGLIVSAALLAAAALIRIFAIPKFKYKPGKLQMLIESLVGFFENLAKSNSPHHHGFLGAYIFGAGIYVFFGTLFELVGVQVITTGGHPITLPAPLSDINGAISMGCLSYLVILSGGVIYNGVRGVGRTLKDFSLPISMSFRLFGALLSGLLITELVYYYLSLSFVLPVVVAVLFTLLHALIQTYVLAMLTALFYGEVSEPHEKKEKKKKIKSVAID